jgi:hypothetical protein
MAYAELEDRIVVTGLLAPQGEVKGLLTRRLALKLQSIIEAKMNEPWYFDYELDQLQQRQSETKTDNDGKTSPSTQTSSATSDAAVMAETMQPDLKSTPIYLFTEVMVQIQLPQFILAFKGLKMPQAMIEQMPHEPVFAVSLAVEQCPILLDMLVKSMNIAKWLDEPSLYLTGLPHQASD